MFSEPAAIYSWLSQLGGAVIHDDNRDNCDHCDKSLEARPDASAKRKRQAHAEMTTPPSSGPRTTSSSPSSKKRKVGDGDDFDPARSPARADPTRPASPVPPLLRSPSDLPDLP